jgi:hypothetical protein
MAIKLYSIPGDKWWIEYDDATFEITNTYNKPRIEADINAITATLALPQYPVPSEVDKDINLLITAVTNNANLTEERKARIINMLKAMYQAYMDGDALYLEAAALIEKRAGFIALLARLV